MLESILVFDIETIPDVDVCFQLTGNKSTDFLSQKRAMEEYHLEITNGENPFLRQLFHRIIVLSFIKIKITRSNGYDFYSLENLGSKTINEYTEEEIVKSFFNYWEKEKPKIVTFNGRTFDIPVLKFRALKYNVTAREIYTAGDKWNNYFGRYSVDWHTDLLDVLSDYGSSARIKMHEICSILKLPGKISMDGSNVAQCYYENKVNEIMYYCEMDVVNTYLIYIKLMYHQGKIDKRCYNQNVEQLINIIQDKKYFAEFYSEWMLLNDNSLYI